MKSNSVLKRADTMFSKYIRDRDGACRAGGTDATKCDGRLQAAHIVSRRYRATRWDETNAMALCGAHHFKFTVNPDEWRAWLRDNDVDWDALYWLANNNPPEKPADAIERMRK